MSGTIRTLSALQTTEFQDGQFKAISAADTRDGWESLSAMVVSAAGQQTASYTAQFTDRGCVVPFNVASGSANFTIPQNIFPVNSLLGAVWVFGAAIQPTFVAGTGVTIRSPTGNQTLRAAASVAWAWQFSSNVWYLLGDLS